MAKEYKYTPEEVAALPEVVQAVDDLWNETKERERFEAWIARFKYAKFSTKELDTSWDAWLARAREAEGDRKQAMALLEMASLMIVEYCDYPPERDEWLADLDKLKEGKTDK